MKNVSVRKERSGSGGELGNLTLKQYAELHKCASKSPDLHFEVVLYPGRTSLDTHICVYRNSQIIGLAGRMKRAGAHCQWYEEAEETKKVARRVMRIFR